MWGIAAGNNDNGREAGGEAIIQRNRFTNRGSEGIEELQAGGTKALTTTTTTTVTTIIHYFLPLVSTMKSLITAGLRQGIVGV